MKHDLGDARSVGRISLAMYWSCAGFPRVVVGHKLAASLMCTSMPAEHCDDLIYPWDVFVIDVPRHTIPHYDMIRHKATDGFFDHLFVFRRTSGCTVLAISRDGLTKHTPAILRSNSIGKLVSESQETKEHPSLHLIARYVVGTVAELDSYRRSPDNARNMASLSQRTGVVTKISTFVMSRDVKVDCREAVRHVAFGQRDSLPAVQVLVRGHWKNQACGKDRKDRRWTHIEPYWRGMDDAPIAIRSHHLGKK